MNTEPTDPIDYTPEPLPPQMRRDMTRGLADRMIREADQQDAVKRNAPFRATEADRRRRQPGGDHA